MITVLCAGGGEWTLMGDEKDTWKVKTLDEILLEKKRRRELEERTVAKRQKKVKSLACNAEEQIQSDAFWKQLFIQLCVTI